MRKLKELLRLESLGLSQHQIARSCSISQSTVHEYVSAARAAGVQWPLPENWDDRQIEQALFPQRPAPAVWRKHPEPDWPPILEELQKHRDLTLALVWQERRESDPEGYGYSRFCDLYRQWLNKRDLVLRQEHCAGFTYLRARILPVRFSFLRPHPVPLRPCTKIAEEPQKHPLFPRNCPF